MFRPILPFVFLLGLSGPGLAAGQPSLPYTWRNAPIGAGGLVSGLVFHPTQPGLLYARTDVGGAYRWQPATGDWRPLNDGLDRDRSDWYGVLALALDRHDAARVYLACGLYTQPFGRKAALLRSADGGATWDTVPLPFKLGANEDGRGTGERLLVDPADSRCLWLASSADGLWRSPDRGTTWARVPGCPVTRATLVLAVPGATGKPSTLYVGNADPAGGALWQSDDGGASWRQMEGGPAGLVPHHAAPGGRGDLYVTLADGPGPSGVSRGGVWKHTATGTWQELSPVRPDPATRDMFGYAGLAVVAGETDTLLVSTLDRWTKGDEVYLSRDGGATWRPLLAGATWDASAAPYVGPLHPHWIVQVALDPFDRERAFFVTGYGVWASDHLGDGSIAVRWRFADRGLEELVVSGLVSPPTGPSLFSAEEDYGAFRHDSPDAIAVPVADFHGGSPSLDLAGQDPRRLVRSHWGPARGAQSFDGGTTWTDFAATPEEARRLGPGKLALTADGRRIVWLPKGSVPYFSTDQGTTWRASTTDYRSPAGYNTPGPVSDRVDPLAVVIYDDSNGQLWRSDDGGAHFMSAGQLAPEGGTPAADPHRRGRLWLPTPAGLFRSDDFGRTRVRLETVESAHALGLGAAARADGESTLFLDGRVGGQDGLYRSDDGGATWQRISDEHHRFGWLRVIAGDARVPGRVYLGTSGRGVMVGEPALKP